MGMGRYLPGLKAELAQGKKSFHAGLCSECLQHLLLSLGTACASCIPQKLLGMRMLWLSLLPFLCPSLRFCSPTFSSLSGCPIAPVLFLICSPSPLACHLSRGLGDVFLDWGS